MYSDDRFREIAKTCASIVTRVQNEIGKNPDKFKDMDMSELFYSIGYIEGLCGKEGMEDENNK